MFEIIFYFDDWKSFIIFDSHPLCFAFSPLEPEYRLGGRRDSRSGSKRKVIVRTNECETVS